MPIPKAVVAVIRLKEREMSVESGGWGLESPSGLAATAGSGTAVGVLARRNWFWTLRR